MCGIKANGKEQTITGQVNTFIMNELKLKHSVCV